MDRPQTLRMNSHPETVGPELRDKARLILAEATDPSIAWQSEHMPRVWERIARVLERAADECDLVVKKYLEPKKLMSDRVFTMLTKAIGSRGGNAERAARMVWVQGVPPSQAASETGLSQQAVYAATERYRRALMTLRQDTEIE